MRRQEAVRGGIVLLLTIAVVTGTFSGVAAAETRSGGTIVVEDGETVDGLSAFGGTIIVRGTVDGNLDGAAGSVVIEESGVVTGDVSTAAGSLTIAGEVNGDVDVGTGSFSLARTGVINGSLNVGSGSILIAGTVGGDAKLGADSVRLAETANVGGDVRYAADATFTNDGATVGGSIIADSSLGTGGFDLPDVPGWLFTGYAILVNLVLGAALLAVLPGFSRRIDETVSDEPAKSAGVGVLAMLGIPIGLVLLAVTIIGIPLTIAGFVAFALLAWVALLYGRIAVAAWALRQADVDNRWLALVVGIVGFGLLGRIPILGGLISLATFLLGLGAIALVLVELRRGSGDSEEPEPAVESPMETDESDAGAI
ncbi:bactofilin family protein [Halapricum hydrolyticum]|uniref:Polymer-forming cytoskeletal protein n=1 Tax=Halapricum hydrolyticum TaxID=2979991 RepID=A0AAE3LFL5_9EURY|nr:polymer-forming cytoskeletal protein [Halapricum hydrolyticum]MCU4718679.1 polymer-forming cytoskeletal protein [Halapricum hydrolyticum]MCU4727635.1 polymer-forming cytoskeletal protein [Halapricum hydrolyticum]